MTKRLREELLKWNSANTLFLSFLVQHMATHARTHTHTHTLYLPFIHTCSHIYIQKDIPATKYLKRENEEKGAKKFWTEAKKEKKEIEKVNIW